MNSDPQSSSATRDPSNVPASNATYTNDSHNRSKHLETSGISLHERSDTPKMNQGGIFSYLLRKKKTLAAASSSSPPINSKILGSGPGGVVDSSGNPAEISETIQTTTNNPRMNYHKFATVGASNYFGSSMSDSDDDDNNATTPNKSWFISKLKSAPATNVNTADSITNPSNISSADEKNNSWMNQAWKTMDNATEWMIATPSSNESSSSWVWNPSSVLPTSLSSSISSYTPSNWNIFTSSENSTNLPLLENNSHNETIHENRNNSNLLQSLPSITNSAFLPRLAAKFDWATKRRNPYQGVVGRDADFLLSPSNYSLFSSWLEKHGWFPWNNSYIEEHRGDDNGTGRDSADGNEAQQERSKRKKRMWKNRAEKNTPSDASLQAVKNLLTLVTESKSTALPRSRSSVSSSGSWNHSDYSGHETNRRQMYDFPHSPPVPSESKHKSSPIRPFPDLDISSSDAEKSNSFPLTDIKKNDDDRGIESQPNEINEKKSFDSYPSSYGHSPHPSPVMAETVYSSHPLPSSPRYSPRRHSDSHNNLHTRSHSPIYNPSTKQTHPWQATNAEMSARLAEGTLRAYRDLALDEATELHSALRFWSLRWERPDLGWIEAGPTVWFSEKGYSPHAAGQIVSQIQAVLARRCAAIGEMQQHLWRANWQRGVAEWGMLGRGGEWAAVVGGDGGMENDNTDGMSNPNSGDTTTATSPGTSDDTTNGLSTPNRKSNPKRKKKRSLTAIKIFNHSSVVGTNVSNSRGGHILMDQEELAAWSIDAMRVVRDQLYRAGSGVKELPMVENWPRERRHFRSRSRGYSFDGAAEEEEEEGLHSDLPIWATEDVGSGGLSEASRFVATEALSGTSLQSSTKIENPLPKVNNPTKPSNHSSIVIVDLPKMADEVSALLESMQVHLAHQRQRRLNRLRPPSRIRRNWYIAAIGIPTFAYLTYKLTKEHGGLILIRQVLSKIADIFHDHVSEPLYSIYQELFTKSGRLDVTDRKARIDAIESLKKMIRSWLDESFPKMPLEEKIERAESMDISLIEQSMEESIKHIYEINSVVRMSLIEMQFIKKELMNALVAMDELMGSNEINMRIAAMTPAVIILIAIRRLFRVIFYAFFQVGKSKEEIYASFRQTILDIERLLVMRDNPPSAPDALPWGSTRSPTVGNTNESDTSISANDTKNNQPGTLSADDLGMLLLQIHECRNILWQSRRRFPSDVIRNVAEDLAELAGERGPVSVSQQLQIISRMSRTYPFMKVVSSGVPFDMIMPAWR